MASARGFIVGVVVGAGVTVGLFMLMQQFIKVEPGEPQKPEPRPDIDIVGAKPEPPEPEPDDTPQPPDDTPEPPPPPPAPPTNPVPDGDGPITNPPPIPGPTPPDPDGLSRDQSLPVIRISPVYPRRMAQQGIEGDVTVEFDIDAQGNVRNPRVISSTNAGFERAAIAAVQRWKYAPKTVNGQAVEQRNVRVTLQFRLDEED